MAKLGDYEVAVTIGPSYATKRAEAADSMLAFMKAVPQAAPFVGDLIAKNMDWPGAEEIATRLAAQLPPQLLGKNMKDFPPEAKAIITSLKSSTKNLAQDHQKALAMLGDKEADRALQADKQQKDFEAKLAKVAADLEKSTATNIEKAMDRIMGAVNAAEDRASRTRDSENKALLGLAGNLMKQREQKKGQPVDHRHDDA